jgi:2-polyprenyl-3-methyl-5-hydroxy-6-metoxy-1,4-benzoquinol methylase
MFDPARKNVPAYQGLRKEILSKILRPRQLLDLGCNEGALAAALRSTFPACELWGIEINPAALNRALPFLSHGFCLNLEDLAGLENALNGRRFDHIIAADVVEHVMDPCELIRVLYEHLEPGGKIVVSVPNVAHWEIFCHLLRLNWPVRDRGIFDATHKRFL